jgi:hypothetical protein
MNTWGKVFSFLLIVLALKNSKTHDQGHEVG